MFAIIALVLILPENITLTGALSALQSYTPATLYTNWSRRIVVPVRDREALDVAEIVALILPGAKVYAYETVADDEPCKVGYVVDVDVTHRCMARVL